MASEAINTAEDAEMPECDGEKVVTMMDVLQEQEDFEEDANAVLGASDDKNCTYSKGYIKRQAIYACMTCCSDAKSDPTKRAGVCLACSLTCHENHELVELYTKRNFRCDCGNPKFNSHPCQYTPNKIDFNDENSYNQNFSGLYCVCKRPYPDPESTVEDEMIQCIICEDWLHASHLEATVPANDQYSEMICKECMVKNDFLHDYTNFAVNTENLNVDVTTVNGIGNHEIESCNDSSKIETTTDTIDKNESLNSADVEMEEKVPSKKSFLESTKESITEKINHSNVIDTNKPVDKMEQTTDHKNETEGSNQPEANISNKPNESAIDEVSTNKEMRTNNDEGKNEDIGVKKNCTDHQLNTEKNDKPTSEESSNFNKVSDCETATNEQNEDNTKPVVNDVSTDKHENAAKSEEQQEEDRLLEDPEEVPNNSISKDKGKENKCSIQTTDSQEKETKDENLATEINKTNSTQENSSKNPNGSLNSVKETCNDQQNDTDKNIETSKEKKLNDNKDSCETKHTTENSKKQDEESNVKIECSPDKNGVENTEKFSEKRKLSIEESTDSEAKKKKTEESVGKPCIRPKDVQRVHKGATFWPSTFRQKLCTCTECLTMYKDLSVLFLIDPEDTVLAYESLGKAIIDGKPSSQYEKGLQALSSLDRIQQINALTEYNKMRDKLLDFLKSFKDRKEIVKEEDIKAFFAGMKPKREPDGVYFCR